MKTCVEDRHGDPLQCRGSMANVTFPWQDQGSRSLILACYFV